MNKEPLPQTQDLGPRPVTPEETVRGATLPPEQVTDRRTVRVPEGEEPTELPAIPGYEIQRVLGRGGMGVVYLARQANLDRLVALKMVLAGEHASQDQKRRFLAEAAVIARLRHPGIVQVYEFGHHEGRPYFALEYVAGGSLEQYLRSAPTNYATTCHLVAHLADAVQAAHEQGIVHRDLKPANVLLVLSRAPEARALDGPARASGARLIEVTAKITDFGLAKQLDTGPALTASGAIMGTPSYMAPEQAAGQGKKIGPATDVYALGAILYECLTGQPPFRGTTAYDTLLQVMHTEPVPPRQVRATVPRDVQTICLKCLEKDPARRYSSAAALAQDLRRYLDGEPISARPVGRSERAWRWCRRNPVLASLGGAVLLLLGLVTFLGLRGTPAAVAERPTTSGGQRGTADADADEVLQIVKELDRTEPGWRLEQMYARQTPLPPERNNAPLMEATHQRLPADWDTRVRTLNQELGNLAWDQPLSPRQAETLQATLHPAQPALTAALKLADLPDGRYAVNWSRGFLTTMMPHLNQTRDVVWLITWEILASAERGDFAQALRLCRAGIHAGRSVGDEPAAISQVMRMAAVLSTLPRLEQVLARGEAPEADVAALQATLAREAAHNPLYLSCMGERAGMHLLMATATAGDFAHGVTDQTVAPEFAQALRRLPEGTALRPAHAWLLRQLTALVTLSTQPSQNILAGMQQWEKAVADAPAAARILLFAAPQVVNAHLRHLALVRCALVLLAVERYRLHHRRWPTNLTELTPQFLPQLPTDPYTGTPLGYRVHATGVTVYAVGPDGTDNGGNLASLPIPPPGEDLGFRLLDPARRGRLPRSQP